MYIIDIFELRPLLFNFIMSKKRVFENPEIDLSFNRENKHMHKQEQRLNVEILRVQAVERQRTIQQIWSMNQNQLCQYFTNYSLFPTLQFSIEQLLDSPNLKLVKADSKIYFGEIYRKNKHGLGIYFHKEGRVYQGEFINNQKSGQGVEIYPNGNLYIGEFFNNKKHGKGVFYWYNLTNHQQQQYSAFIENYEGEWWGGLPDGLGTHRKINGDLYIGNYKNGLKHGQGVEHYGNGDYYKGEYVNGMPQGCGQYLWNDGSLYKGDFKQGERSGYGVWQTNKNKSQSYRGHYSNDKKAGYGVFVWQNGWCYKGNFDNDYRDGYGELYQANNELHYKGFWHHGQPSQKEKQNNQQARYKFNGINLKSTQYSKRPEEKEQQQPQENMNFHQSNHQYKAYNNQEQRDSYATVSQFGQANLCKRPNVNRQFSSQTHLKSTNNQQGYGRQQEYQNKQQEYTNRDEGYVNRPTNSSRNVRIREGRIGTSINRPINQSAGRPAFRKI